MTKNDQRIFFDLLRAENSKILYIVLAFLINFILTAIFKTQFLEITTFALLAIIAIWAMSQEHKDKKTYTHLSLSSYYQIIKKGRILYFQAINNDKRLTPLKGYHITNETMDTYIITVDYRRHYNLTAIVAKKDVIEDPTLLPHIEEEMKTMPDFFGL
jgi:hypothetical protein